MQAGRLADRYEGACRAMSPARSSALLTSRSYSSSMPPNMKDNAETKVRIDVHPDVD
jgi:hypothetical protein